MNKTLYSFVIASIICGALAFSVNAEVVSDSSTDISQDGISQVITDPSTDGSQDGGSTISSPSTDGDQDGSAPIISTPSSDASQDGQVNPSNTNIPVSASSGSSRSSMRSIIGNLAIMNIASSCPIITSYMKMGVSNDTAQVTRLQAFLKNIEKADVTVTGTFDTKTEDAVKAFQAKYLSDVLGPWGATRPSGVVYITTVKKINEIACAQQLTLNADEMKTIEAYKSHPAVESNTADEQPASIEVGTAQDESSNVAATSDASVVGRLWGFLKGLFR